MGLSDKEVLAHFGDGLQPRGELTPKSPAVSFERTRRLLNAQGLELSAFALSACSQAKRLRLRKALRLTATARDQADELEQRAGFRNWCRRRLECHRRTIASEGPRETINW